MEKEFKAKFTADNKDLKRKMDDTEKKGKTFSQKMKAIGLVLASVFAIGKIIEFGKELIGLASKAEGVRTAFMALNKPTLLDDLRKATRGTVDDITLMQKSVQAKNFKIPLEQLATYFEFATKRAIQTGESVDYLVDSIITGIGRKSVLVMDNLGISAVELQEEVKKTGDFATAAGVIIQRELTGMGDVADTTAIKIGKLKTIWQNFKTEAGKAITLSVVFGEVLQWLSDEAEIWANTELSFWEKLNGSPNDYKIWKQQQETLRDTWRETFSNLSDIELQVRRGVMADKEANRQIELEIKERTKKKAILQDELKVLRELNDHSVKKHIPTIAETKVKIEELTDSLETLSVGEGKRAEQIKTQIADLQTLIDEILNYKEVIRGIAGPEKVDISHLATPKIAPDIDSTSLQKYGGELANVIETFTAAELASKAFGDQIMAAGIQGSESMEDFGRTALNIAKKVIAAYVAEAIAGAVKSALVGVPFPFNLIAAGIAGGMAAALINAAIPEFAAGGGVSGPTMAMVGEAPGISRSNPEYIGTASQLAQMGIGGGRLTTRISRGDLLFILNEGKSFNTRNY